VTELDLVDMTLLG